jgi:hypothetical protein
MKITSDLPGRSAVPGVALGLTDAYLKVKSLSRYALFQAPNAVEAEVVGETGAGGDLTPRHPLLGDVQTESHDDSSAEARLRPLTALTVDEQIDALVVERDVAGDALALR